VDNEELISAIRALQDDGVRLTAIEKKVKVPRNTLSGMLNGTRPFKEKWRRKLIAYVIEMHNVANVASIPPPNEPPPPILPRTTKMPPTGLSKSDILKWHRQNSRNL
jgi:hypothetical protein